VITGMSCHLLLCTLRVRGQGTPLMSSLGHSGTQKLSALCFLALVTWKRLMKEEQEIESGSAPESLLAQV
jgi:hypothetical protein